MNIQAASNMHDIILLLGNFSIGKSRVCQGPISGVFPHPGVLTRYLGFPR